MPLPAAGLGRQKKLLNGAQFRQVFRHKNSVHGKHFGVHGTGNSEPYSRLGITVSKRVSKKAVQRNRIKRQIRESFRMHQKDLGPREVVVVPLKAEAENARKPRARGRKLCIDKFVLVRLFGPFGLWDHIACGGCLRFVRACGCLVFQVIQFAAKKHNG